MNQLLELETDGGSILVEATALTPGHLSRGAGGARTVTKTGKRLERVLGDVGPAVRGLVAELRSALAAPDEVEVEFAITLSTDANVIIARGGDEANFRITARWKGAP
jgi:hypothetical protein